MLGKIKSKFVNWLLKGVHLDELHVGKQSVVVSGAGINMDGQKVENVGAPDSGDDAPRRDTIDSKIAAHVGVAGAHHNTPTVGAVLSDNLRNSNDAERSKTSLSYVKIKEVLLNDDLPACRLKFDVKRNIGGWAYGKVYKNGAAIGSDQGTSSGSYVTKSEDFSGWVSGDLIQIYAKRSDANNRTYIRNMRFYYDATIATILGKTLVTGLPVSVGISTTNQDP